ncbi:MAG: hypothetical protein HFH48_00895 [Lachnospiraceae bacterium]|nr:hypothetical protein [Lachnospiraceae bacterium]
MDKYEYKLKLEQLKNLVQEKDYKTAAEIADTINWRKVKSAAVLCMVGEIYDRNKQYENSHEILLMAYDRATVGRNIIYRLALVALKMGRVEEAKEYYEEFLEVAPYDNLKYVLRYQIAKIEGASQEELIEILEEFKEREYTEEWAFELAYLYHRSGNSERCVEVCDELVLWFGDGKYVEKALELKMLYQPLNKFQEEKYRQFKMSRDGVVEVRPTDALESGEIVHETMQIPDITANQGRFNTMNLQEELAKSMQQIMDASTKEIVTDTMDNIKKMVEEIPYLQVPQEEEEYEEEERYGHIETDEEIDGSLKDDFREMLAEDWDGQFRFSVPGGDWREPQVNGQMKIEDVLIEWEKTRRAAEAAMAMAQQRRLESAKARALQEAEELMERLNEIIPKLNAGISPQELLAERYLQNEEEETAEMERNWAEDVDEIEDWAKYPQEAVEEDWAEHIEEPENWTEMNQEPENWPESAQEPENWAEHTKEPENWMERPGEPQEEAGWIPEEESQETVQEETGRIPEEESQETVREETGRIPEEESQEAVSVPEEHWQEEAAEKKNLEYIQKEIEQPAELMEEQIEDVQGDLQGDGNLPAEQPENTISDKNLEVEIQENSEAKERPKKDMQETSLEDLIEQQAVQEELESERKDAEQYLESVFKAAKAAREEKNRIPRVEIEKEKKENVSKEQAQGEYISEAVPEMIPEVGIDPEEEPVTKLSEEQKEIFSYFVPVTGMEQQLCQVLEGALHRKSRDRTSASGNILIMGGRGSGKTVLATDIIKAIQRSGKHSGGKVGKITGEALNQKDLSQLLKKIAGGYLIIEHAGKISQETATRLSLLMEQDTDGLLFLMEDTRKGIEKALNQDANFAKKFTEQIRIPVFTSDELVEFAKAYAYEQECEIDDMGILALYNCISNIQKLDEATTLSEVKEIVDSAISSAERGGLKKLFGGKKFSPEGYLYLREKDFDN